jgi:hypothetical protein
MPRFSIVVTSTDRPAFLNACVRAVLGGSFEDIEVIVSDNFSKIPVTEVLADIKDERLRIIRTDSRLAVPDHWEFVWGHITGEFVTYLGDKSALHPDILATADKAIRDFDLDIMAWRVCTYFYPDWNVEYGALPSRGNVVFLEPGTTQKLYQCDTHAVLDHFCQNLRMYGCFPCMFGYVFRKALADQVHDRCHGIFKGAVPETSSSFIVLGMCRPGKYAFFDAFGAIAGRPGDSSFASMLSRGKTSQRMDDYLAEFKGRDLLENHMPKLHVISNYLASVISQARKYLPEHFSQYDFNHEMLARKVIDDCYVDRTVPYFDSPTLLQEIDDFIKTLPSDTAQHVFAYRDECRAKMDLNDPAIVPPGGNRTPPATLASLLKFWGRRKRLAWELFHETGRYPFDKYWISGGAACVDMSLYGCEDLAGVSDNFTRVLDRFDTRVDGFAKYYTGLGMLGRTLADDCVWYRPPPIGHDNGVDLMVTGQEEGGFS